MSSNPSIISDMQSEQKIASGRSDELGFYLVASSRELLQQVEGLMNREGVFGVMDSSGRVHYLVDARKGSPYAARQIRNAAGRLISDRKGADLCEKKMLEQAVEEILARYAFNDKLRGFRLLRSMLIAVVPDRSLLDPISKRLYPKIAKIYGVSAAQAERNVRYLFDDLARTEQRRGIRNGLLEPGETSLPAAESVYRLSEQVRERFLMMRDNN